MRIIQRVGLFAVVAILFFPNLRSLGGSSAQTRPAAADETDSLSRIMASPMPARAILELSGKPVVTQLRETVEALGNRERLDFKSERSASYEAALLAEQDDFLARAKRFSPHLRVVTRLQRLANAISVEAPGTEIAILAVMPDVRRVEVTGQLHALTDRSVPLIEAPALWQKLGGKEAAGQGVKIAIVDSGIDETSPLFADAGFTAPIGFPRGDTTHTNNKVIVAKAFLPGGNTSPIDENGHGTSVAGIAAGVETSSPIGTLSGVAPRAFLGNYRCLDKDGSGTDDFAAKAVEEAVSDGFDVINLSLGHATGPFIDTMTSVVEGAVLSGAIVVVAAGNDGLSGQFTITTPGVAPSAITVGASSNAHIIGPQLSVMSPEPVPDGLTGLRAILGVNGSGTIGPGLGPLPYLDGRAIDGQGLACGGFPSGSMAGAIGLIQRGQCSFSIKVNAADAAGATAVIVYNNDASAGPDSGETLLTMNVVGTNIPSVFLKHSDGEAVRSWLQAHPSAQVAISAAGEFNSVPDILAAFSSTGPSLLGTIKPDVVAPGVMIYSGAVRTPAPRGVSDPSGFAPISGTSQAAPHVTGAAALLKQLHPSWTPVQIKSALMSSAVVDVFSSQDTTLRTGLLASGAGRINLAAASQVTATISPPSVSFGFAKLKKKKVNLSSGLSVTNVSNDAITFSVTTRQLDPGAGIDVTASPNVVSLAPGQTGRFTFVLAANKKIAEKRDYTGYILLTDSLGHTLHVPYWVGFGDRLF